VIENKKPGWEILYIICSILLLAGFLGYLTEMMTAQDNVEKVSNFIFIMIQISISLAGFTFLAEVIEKRSDSANEIRKKLITATRFFIYDSFLLLLGFFLIFVPEDTRNSLPFLNYSVRNGTIFNWSIVLCFFCGFILFICGFYCLLGAINQTSDEINN
jgi:hypothetical protein